MSRPFHEEAEAGTNKQINLELCAMYTYLSLSSYFEREDVALQGFARYFRKASDEKMEHAKELMKFQNDRGGRIVLGDIKKPAKDEWGSGLDAMEAALDLETTLNQALLDLHKIADKHNDFHMADFLEGEFLREQVESIKQLSDHITNLRKVGPGHGEYHFDDKTL